VIIDGGTHAGIMALMGDGVAGRGYRTELIGVAPANKVTYPESKSTAETPLEPNHSHFVLVEGNEWGSETAMLFSLANALISKNEEVKEINIKPRKQDSEKVANKLPAV